VVAGFLLFAASPAQATWSIVAVDPETRQVGAAGASCIEDVEVIAGLVPGTGVVVAQSVMNEAGRDRGVELLRAGRTPLEILAEITSLDFDSERWLLPGGRSWRQYAIASLDGPSQAAFTGEKALAWNGSMQAPGVAVAGNILVGPDVVARALLAFGTPGGGDQCTPTLADRLVAALWAGAQAGGDRRCVAELAALSAFVEVANPDDTPDAPSLRIVVPYTGSRENGLLRQGWRQLRPKRGTAQENPVRKLRELYLSWSERQGAPSCLAQP
jgi:uncharacterized Ntn-hydrolase superfamily protein